MMKKRRTKRRTVSNCSYRTNYKEDRVESLQDEQQSLIVEEMVSAMMMKKIQTKPGEPFDIDVGFESDESRIQGKMLHKLLFLNIKKHRKLKLNKKKTQTLMMLNQLLVY